MHNFNQIESLWQSQNNASDTISAEEVLAYIKNNLNHLRNKNYGNIAILGLIALGLIAIMLSNHLAWTTQLGVALIDVAVVMAIYHLFKSQLLLQKSNYLEAPRLFIEQLKNHQLKKLYLYQDFYWIYTACITLGLVFCFIELIPQYTTETLLIIGFLLLIWIGLCSTLIRKIAIKKVRQETMELIQQLENLDKELV